MDSIGKHIKALLIAAAIVSACTERIELKLDESDKKLVVEGFVSTDTTVHRIILTTTTGYYYNGRPPTVSGATVKIMTGAAETILNEVRPGIYETDSTFFGLAGETYTLDIELKQSIGGFSTYSAVTKMGDLVKIDSLTMKYQKDWSENGIWQVFSSFRDPVQLQYYRFMIYINDKLLTDDLGDWFVSDDRFWNGAYVTGTPVAFLDQSEDDEVINEGDTISVELNNIDEDFAWFISDAQAEMRGSNPLFSGPPANVKGNISNGAIGYFAAFTVSRSEIIAGTGKR